MKRNMGLSHLLLVACTIAIFSWLAKRGNEAPPQPAPKPAERESTSTHERYNIQRVYPGVTEQNQLPYLLGEHLEQGKSNWHAQREMRLMLKETKHDFGLHRWLYPEYVHSGVRMVTIGHTGIVRSVWGVNLNAGEKGLFRVGVDERRVIEILGQPDRVHWTEGRLRHVSFADKRVHVYLSRTNPPFVSEIAVWAPPEVQRHSLPLRNERAQNGVKPYFPNSEFAPALQRIRGGERGGG